jgi:hypothetical protein
MDECESAIERRFESARRKAAGRDDMSVQHGVIKDGLVLYSFECFPDTIDPRAPKDR